MNKNQNLIITGFIIINTVLLVIVFLLFKNKESDNNSLTDQGVERLIKASEYQYICENTILSAGEATDSLFRLANTAESLLTLRLSENHCEVCIVQALNDFLELSKSLSPARLLIISTIGDKRSFESMKKKVFPIPVINVKTTNSLMEETNTPFLFLLYPNLQTSTYILYQKEFPEKSAAYFKAVKNILATD